MSGAKTLWKSRVLKEKVKVKTVNVLKIVKSKTGHWTLDSVWANVKQLSMSGTKTLCKRRVLNTYLRQQWNVLKIAKG